MKFSHQILILLAGIIWLIIGMVLLSFGITLILEIVHNPELSHIAGKFSLAGYSRKYFSSPTHSVIFIITLALILGHFKGKMALAKSVNRQIKRIESLPNPAPLKYLYSKGYYLLIICMIFLGISIKYIPITVDTRGAIDVTIGSALINGAMLYFRYLTQKIYSKKVDL